jgi:hypothetical protein
MTTNEQMHKAVSFASALGKLKAKQELGEGAELTVDEVDGLIWAIRQLRGGSARVPADHSAQR